MTEKLLDPHRLDMSTFARAGASLAGDLPLADLSRLAGSLLIGPASELPPVTWRADGSQRLVRGGQPETWLHLRAQAGVVLECQRCLQPVQQMIEIDRHFRFVAGEDEATRLDEDSEDDVLVLPPSLDLATLVEDELILALPLVPRHEACPQPLPMSVADAGALAEDDEPHPFAALAALRGPNPVN